MMGKIIAQRLSDQISEDDLPVPVRNLEPQSFHALKSSALSLLLTTARWLDGVAIRGRRL